MNADKIAAAFVKEWAVQLAEGLTSSSDFNDFEEALSFLIQDSISEALAKANGNDLPKW
mgnify:CR=1 FL=1